MLARALLVALIAALVVPSAAGAVTRYAALNGDNVANDCTDPNDPCTLGRAVEVVAVNTDEVVVSPGTYQLEAGTNGELLVDTGLTIHGVDGLARPVITRNSANSTLNVTNNGGANLRHLDVRNTNSIGTAIETSIAGGSAGSRNITDVVASANMALDIVGGGWLIRDSYLHGTGTGSVGARLRGKPFDLRNVTAIGEAFGLAGQGNCGPNNGDFVLKNVIARGATSDIAAQSTCGTAGITSHVHVSFSNYRASNVSVTNGKGQISDDGNNQTATDPLFAADGFHQLSNSPTVDAGTADVLNGPFDIDGEARTLGPKPDIGADETLFVAPAAPAPPAGGSPPVGPAARDRVAPVASSLLLGAAFPAANRGASIAARRRVRPTGTTVRYRLSEPAAVRFTVEKPRPGRRVNRRCVPQTRANRTRPRCIRFVAVGSFTHAGRAGANSFQFTGRVGGRKLAPGSYRLVAVPTDVALNRGAAVRRTFRVIA